MVVKETKYSRTFISQTKGEIEEDIFPRGINGFPQIINEEDEKIRKETIRLFAFEEVNRYGGEGFDGKIWYSWRINGEPIKVSEKNIEYQTEVIVKKAGAENEICFWSDLEKFLIKNDFKELK
jgi:hypothetical protein